MGQRAARIVSLVRNPKIQRHQALARRWKMARPRLELLARHAAVLLVDLVNTCVTTVRSAGILPAGCGIPAATSSALKRLADVDLICVSKAFGKDAERVQARSPRSHSSSL